MTRIETELTIANLTEQRFESSKHQLISAFAKSLNVSETLVEMKLEKKSREKRETTLLNRNVIIIASVVVDVKEHTTSINEIDFVSSMNNYLSDFAITVESIDITTIKSLTGKF